MKKGNKIYQIIYVLICLSLVSIYHSHIFAQDWAKIFNPNQQRVDLRHLGFPEVNEIPEYNSAITSLLTAQDGIIYGGTTGEEAYLFMFNPAVNKVQHLGKIPGQESVHHSLAEDSLGFIYIGTGKNMFNQINLTQGENWDSVNDLLWSDIKAQYKNYSGGHLYRYNPRKSNNLIKLADSEAEITDLGVPVPQNSIYSITCSPDGSTIYGITYPDAKFFLFDINKQKFEIIGDTDNKIVYHGPERHWRSVSRDLICDSQGNVYFSGTDGILKYYSPETKSFISTDQKIPGDYYPAQFYEDYCVVEYFVRDSLGQIYGGTSDGYLFVFNPDQMRLRNLGKPRASRRLRCLTIGFDGNIYLIAGESPNTNSVPCKLYAYNPNYPEFIDYGMLIVDRSPYYYRRGYQFDCMTTGKDGTIYLGESEYRSNLFLLIPPLQD